MDIQDSEGDALAHRVGGWIRVHLRHQPDGGRWLYFVEATQVIKSDVDSYSIINKFIDRLDGKAENGSDSPPTPEVPAQKAKPDGTGKHSRD